MFTGRDLAADGRKTLYFQDAGSYRQGIRFKSAETGDAIFYAQTENQGTIWKQ